jgi:hypothetical protein
MSEPEPLPRQSIPAPQPLLRQRIRRFLASPNIIRAASVAVFFLVWEY